MNNNKHAFLSTQSVCRCESLTQRSSPARSRATSCRSGKQPRHGWTTVRKSSSPTRPGWRRGVPLLTCRPPAASTSWSRRSSPRWRRTSLPPWPSRDYEHTVGKKMSPRAIDFIRSPPLIPPDSTRISKTEFQHDSETPPFHLLYTHIWTFLFLDRLNGKKVRVDVFVHEGFKIVQ